MGFTCIYRRPVTTNAQPQDQFRYSDMESRLQAVENMLQQVTANHSNANSEPPSEGTLRWDSGYGNIQNTSQARVSLVDGSFEDSVDGMGSITFAGEAVSHCFGPSSNSAFAARLMRLLASKRRAQGQLAVGEPASTQDLSAAISRPSSPLLPNGDFPQKLSDALYLPPREEVLRLVERFFATTGAFFPYINKNALIETINNYAANSSLALRKSWLSLLNAIMAIGTSLTLTDSQDIAFDEARANRFLQRAMDLSPWLTSNSANLETVQALAVMTQYSEGTCRSAQTWRLHGVLVQAAYQIGLHLDNDTPNLPRLERETRRRTWYMCFVLDR